MAAPTAAGKSVTGCGSTLPGTSTDIAFFGPLKSPCEFFFSFHISIINIYLFPSRICVLFYIYIFVLPSFSMPCFALIVPSVLGKFSFSCLRGMLCRLCCMLIWPHEQPHTLWDCVWVASTFSRKSPTCVMLRSH